MRGPPASMLWRRSPQRTPPHCRWASHTWAHTSLKCHAVEETTLCTEQHVQRQTLSLVGAADDANDAMCLVRSAAQHRGRAAPTSAVRCAGVQGHLNGLALSGLTYTARGFAAQQLLEEWNARGALSTKATPLTPPTQYTHTHIHWALPKGFLQDEVPASNIG